MRIIFVPTLRGLSENNILLNHDLGLCPNSFTFGKAQASLAFHSLNHDLLAVHDEQALLETLREQADFSCMDARKAVY